MSSDPRLSKIVQSLPPSGIRKFFDLANEMKGEVISLSIGEPDFVTPWHIREKGILSLEKGKTHYSPNQGYIELRETITEYLDRKFDLKYDPRKEVVVTVGGSEAIDAAVRAIVDPGDEVIIPEPCFVAYKACVILAGAVPVPLPCNASDGFKPDPDKLRRIITEKTKLVILGYPTNPTGTTLSREDLKPIAGIIADKDLLVLSDELYAELIYDETEHFSISKFEGMRERTIVINGLSKAFAMTGWRIGFAVGPESLIAAINRIHQYVIMSSPTTAQYAAIEALKNGDESVEAMRTEYDTRRKILLEALSSCGLECIEPKGAFYAFPSIKSTGMTSEDFCEKFLLSKKVAIVPGTAFGDAGEGHVRISYAASSDSIIEAMHRLGDFCAEVTRR
ncbi:MAG: aminotransferase class I/II-fold pyridoxal phosphate-dependent enzyme [Eubacteriales bacterium]|nr:aminotransferase class I/II-fold pyridoxal phosphate-dependent enzyme [Eubacteriales bacterium]MDD4327195.1 aminotransferase class I/II-fold pyridoxal phosphate-dependent enzyme [Eubacteriales bacterium]MDD4718074.1 aminotransferase class I/II-fold pyridoxal phosphate-dependent enzyme [Eubacteriales bacterium]